jgi:radical SAM protein (TIGR01212 family)
VDAGFSCPHVTAESAGCVFCDNRSFSPSRRLRIDDKIGPTVIEQIDQGIGHLERRYPRCDRYIAYFQPSTNTYGPIQRLKDVYEQAANHPRVVGLAIGTRPDCVADDVLDVLSDLATRTHLSVEYGVQTMHDRSLDWMNRGHRHDATVDAVTRSHGRGFEIGAHMIVGLPDETRADAVATAGELARLQVNAVKIHNLFAVKNTPLAGLVRRGDVKLIERGEYVQTVADILEVLPADIVIQRLSGDAPRDFLVAPAWCLDKSAVRRAVETELARRHSWQGKARLLARRGSGREPAEGKRAHECPSPREGHREG